MSKNDSGRAIGDKDVGEEFEIIIAIPEAEPKPHIPANKLKDLIDLLDSLKWNRRTLLRYISSALRLRRLEKEYGRSFTTLVKDYERLSKEEVKLKYSIQQLHERRRKIEEDLKLYMEQHSLTLEAVKRTAAIADELRRSGLELGDLEKALKVIVELKGLGFDANRVTTLLSKYDSLSSQVKRLEDTIEEKKAELRRIESERERLSLKLKEEYGYVMELEKLSGELERLRVEKEALLGDLTSSREELERVRKDIESLLKAKFEISDLDTIIGDKRNMAAEMERKIEELKTELSELLEVDRSVREIISKRKELTERLEALEKEIREREEYLGLLEGELAAAYSVLRLLQDPEGGTLEDLESLHQHIGRLIKIRKGEAIAQRPLEPYFLEKARKALIDLVMPHIKKDFVPRWAFERVEKELKTLSEKRVMLEEEIASLRRMLEAREKPEEPRAVERKEEVPLPALIAVSPDGVVESLKTLIGKRKARITCIYCGEHVVTDLPSDEELESLVSRRWRLRFRCERCGKVYDIQPEAILRKVRGGS